MKPVLALDLASVTGWAVGEPGKLLAHGSHRFASKGASHEAIFASAFEWMDSKVTTYSPGIVVWEAPLAVSFKRGATNIDTTTLLFGLPAVMGACTYQRGIYDIRKAEARLVRLHFIGQSPKRSIAKRLVMRQCRLHGWDVSDDNEADACAIWSYMSALLHPELALRPTPMGRILLRGAR